MRQSPERHLQTLQETAKMQAIFVTPDLIPTAFTHSTFVRHSREGGNPEFDV
jgi:hypothetical protein